MKETEELMLLQRVVNGSDTWTSLQLVNDYIQEVTKYTSKPMKTILSFNIYLKWNSFLLVASMLSCAVPLHLSYPLLIAHKYGWRSLVQFPVFQTHKAISFHSMFIMDICQYAAV